MAGLINLSLTQQLDEYGAPLSGGSLYIIQAGTVATPQNAYQDEALTVAMPNPIPLDAAGRIPQFFLADGQIKVRLQDASGIVKFVADNLLVVGPSTTGGGGGGAVDPTTILATGDLKARYDTAILTGWVRANGLTIGSAVSGATELADLSAQALFQFLWGVDSTLTVSGGRGASASADWTANKQLTLPDWRGRCIAGMDTMGNSAAGRLATVVNGTTLGAAGGVEKVTIAQANLPAVTQTFTGAASGQQFVASASTNVVPSGSLSGFTYVNGVNMGTVSAPSGTISKINPGAQTTMATCSPLMCLTIYIKL